MNKTANRIDVPANIFDYYPIPEVLLPDLDEVCANQGITKVYKKYYFLKKTSVVLNRIDGDKEFLKTHKKNGKFTYKIKRDQKQIRGEHFHKKMKWFQDYYYRMPTSALRELLSETSPPKNKCQVPITSLVKTNEIHVHVCEYCSKVFTYKQGLQDHHWRSHRKLTKMRKRMKSCHVLLGADQDEETSNEQKEPMTPELVEIIEGSIKDPMITSNCVENNIQRKNLFKSPVGLSYFHVLQDKLREIMNRKDNKGQVNEELSSSFKALYFDSSLSSENKGHITADNELQHKNLDHDPLEMSLQVLNACETNKLNNDTRISQDGAAVKNIDYISNDQQEIYQEKNCGTSNMDYLKTVIFGECSKFNPEVTYHDDKSNSQFVKEHSYASSPKSKKYCEKTPLKKKTKNVPCKKRINLDVTNTIQLRLADIKKTRDSIEKFKKIRFALYNEIENNDIQSRLAVLQEKLQVAETT